MIHLCADDEPIHAPIGRPAIVRDRVLATMRTLGRARVERICEETGCAFRSVHDILTKAYARGEVTREWHSRYYVYAVRDE